MKKLGMLDPELAKFSLHYNHLAIEKNEDAQWKAILRYFGNGSEECKSK